jgi:Tol biopolymer transport system component
MDPDGSHRVPLTNDRDPHLQLSACNDGKHITYTTWHEGALSLWSSDADGSNPVKLAVPSLLGGPVCLPDSKWVMYARENALFRIPIEGETPIKLDVPLGVAAYSSDGKLVVYSSQKIEGGSLRSQLVVAPADGGKPLYRFDAPYGLQSAQFTPDSKALAFLLTRNHATNVWKLPLAGTGLEQVTKFTSGDMFAFAWSKDGKQLAFSRGQNKTDVVMMSGFH